MRERTLAFSGHRKLPKGQKLDLLKEQLNDEIDRAIAGGFQIFMVGGAEGFDLLCGELVAKKNDVKLVLVIPFKAQDTNYLQENKKIYSELKQNSQEVIILNEEYTKDCYKKRNQYLIDHSSRLIAYCNGSYRTGTMQTVRMAEKQDLEIINIYENIY